MSDNQSSPIDYETIVRAVRDLIAPLNAAVQKLDGKVDSVILTAADSAKKADIDQLRRDIEAKFLSRDVADERFHSVDQHIDRLDDETKTNRDELLEKIDELATKQATASERWLNRVVAVVTGCWILIQVLPHLANIFK